MASDTLCHRDHICDLTEKGELGLVHKLAIQPTVECSRCGAKAKDLEHVCDPIQLPEVGWMGDGAD